MGSEWSRVSLDELYEFSSGLSKPRSDFGSGYPFLSFKDVFYNSAIPQLTELVNSTEQERLRCSVKRGDVFLTRTSETMDELGMSSVALADIPNATFNGFTKRLRPKDERRVVPEFARYYFRSPEFRSSVTAMSSMSTRASLNNEMLARLAIVLPPPNEQHAIADILGALDDKIELNRRMSETLEAIACAIFKAWFVDFEPVYAKMEGRWQRDQTISGLPAQGFDLFPDKMLNSEIGVIPESWQIRPVSDLAEIVGGTTPSTKESQFWDSGTHFWATPKDLSALQFPVLLQTERRISDAGLAQIGSGLLPAGTVLLSSRAPIGYLAVAHVPVAINQGFIAMKPKPGMNSWFLLLWTYFSHDEILSRANGSTFLEISKSNFRPIPVITPPASLVDLFRQFVEPIYARIVANENQSQILAALRNTLLPKLISGEIRIEHAEQLVAGSVS